MYSKTRNTLTALIAASLFVLTGWMLGHPIADATPSNSSIDARSTVVNTAIHGTNGLVAFRVRHADRMALAMPYFSFALTLPQRRTD